MKKFRLINISSKFKKLLILFFSLTFFSSCDPGCVEPDQFDTKNSYVNSKPEKDGILGGPYNDLSGGETAIWHETGLRTDGNQIILEVTGAWTSWEYAKTSKELLALPKCNICAKKSGVKNCICMDGQKPEPEKNQLSDCKQKENQNNPNLCTCTEKSGTIDDFGVYFIALDYQNKSEDKLNSDNQKDCKYTGGIGLYVGLFGQNNNTTPIKAYHVYPTEKICNITPNANGECIDNAGNDRAKYIFKSPDGKIFIKDDKAGNNGSDKNTEDDEYHKKGEFIKFIIYDRYYSDNYGGYNISFLSGFARDKDNGLLELIVGTVEDVILGKVSVGGKERVGGVIEFLYNSIVKDSTFILIVRMCLTMYIVIFGAWVLFGAIQISRKEVVQRVLKIALVIFFTTETSWYFYNHLVVGFFKDGMDAIIAIFMNASDQIFAQTTLNVSAQADRGVSFSEATRFSYVDFVISKLFSESTARKVGGLFFGEWLGFLYIPLIYGLIFYFTYVMLVAAFVYITALLSLVFVLCLGPIFMITVLFNKTDEIFKRWISFMASQSIQIICLFLVIYMFLILIDKEFNNLFYFQACTFNIDFALFSIDLLKSNADRDVAIWFMIIMKIGALLFLLHMIMEKIPGFAGQLVSINGQKADASGSFVSDTNKSAFALGGDIFKQAATATFKGLNKVYNSGVVGMSVGAVSNIVGNTVGNLGYNQLRESLPFRSPTNRYRDYKIDNIINSQRELGKSKGHTGKDLDQFIRAGTFKEINKQKSAEGVTNVGAFNIFGADNNAISKRLDKNLVEDPLKQVISDSIKEIKQKGDENILLSKVEMRAEVAKKVQEWAKNNSVVEISKFTEMLNDKKGLFRSQIKEEGMLTASEAAKVFAGNEKAKDNYLQHLESKQYKSERKIEEEANKNTLGRYSSGRYWKNKDMMGLSERQDFLHKVASEESYKNDDGYIKGIRKSFDKSYINRLKNRDDLLKKSNKAQQKTLLDYLKKGEGYKKDVEFINKNYSGQKRDKKLDLAKGKQDAFKNKVLKLMDEEEKESQERINGLKERNKDIVSLGNRRENIELSLKENNQKIFQEEEEYKKLIAENRLKKSIIEVSTSDRDQENLKPKDIIDNPEQNNDIEQLNQEIKDFNQSIENPLNKEEKDQIVDNLFDVLSNMASDKTSQSKIDENQKLTSFYRGEQCAIKSKILEFKMDKNNLEQKKNVLEKKVNLTPEDYKELQEINNDLQLLDSKIQKENNDFERLDNELGRVNSD